MGLARLVRMCARHRLYHADALEDFGDNRVDITLDDGGTSSLWWATKNEWLGLLDVAGLELEASSAASTKSPSTTTVANTCSLPPAEEAGPMSRATPQSVSETERDCEMVKRS